MVPVDSFVCQIVQRLRFFRSFDALPQDGRLIARTFAKDTLVWRQLLFPAGDNYFSRSTTTTVLT
jgi:hypothetical protein